ncbi:hypothetical protein ACIPOR_17885 [Photobacterium damselae subsp. piscicida]
MNVSVLGELLENKFHVKEKAIEQKLDGDDVIDAIKQLVDCKGNIDNLDDKYHEHFEKVINTLYQNEIETKKKWRD